MYYVKNIQYKVYLLIILILQYNIVHYKHAVQMMFAKFFHLEFQETLSKYQLTWLPTQSPRNHHAVLYIWEFEYDTEPFSQQPRDGNSLSVHRWWMNRETTTLPHAHAVEFHSTLE